MKVKLIEKGNPQNPTAQKKWYPNSVNQGVVSKNQISKEIEEKSSLTKRDINNVIDNLVEQLPKYLLTGNSVKLGEFGSFRLSVSGEGADSKEKFNPSMIKKVKVVFTPGVNLKKELEDIHFQIVKE